MTLFLSSFLTVAGLHLLAVTSPGPDFIMVTRNAFMYSRKTAVFTALGVALGIVIHISYCILGLAIIIKQSLLLFNIIKILGGCYLIYVGIRALFDKTSATTVPPSTDNYLVKFSSWQALKQGFLCNILNPKVTLFFLGLFTLVIKPGTPLLFQIICGVWMILVTFAWFSFMSILITKPSVRTSIWKIQPALTKIMGAFLLGFGINLIIFIR